MEDIHQLKEGLEYLHNEIESLKAANKRHIAVQRGLQEDLASVKFLVDEIRCGKDNLQNYKLAPANFTMKCLKYVQIMKINNKKRRDVVQFLALVERTYVILLNFFFFVILMFVY